MRNACQAVTDCAFRSLVSHSGDKIAAELERRTSKWKAANQPCRHSWICTASMSEFQSRLRFVWCVLAGDS